MYVSELNCHLPIRPLRLSGREVPHITIEVTMKCNIACRICYNQCRNYEKNLHQIYQEIELARTKRNLDTISLLGGEPTLHPQISEIIRYVKSCRLNCQLLTNGIRFLEDESDELLNNIIAAGVDRIILHMDSGQIHFHDDIESSRRELFEKFEQRKVTFSLAMTIYDENLQELPQLLSKYANYNYFDGVLATLERDAGVLFRQERSYNNHSNMAKLHRCIHDHLDIQPTTYVPTSLDMTNISWLLYFYYINAVTGETFMISPTLNRLFRKIYRFFSGHQVFATTVSTAFRSLLFLLTALGELLLNPKRSGEFIKLIQKSFWLKWIRFHYIVLQDGPRYNREKDCLEFCYNCPDATIRNGMVTPVCLADHINPIPQTEKIHQNSEDILVTVYEHLEEI